MPRPGRKRTRSEADGGGSASRRRGRHAQDDNDDDDGEGGIVPTASAMDTADDGSEADSDGDGDGDGDGASSPTASGQHSWRLPDGYGDEHRAFLQALLARGSLTHSQVQTVIAGILNVGRAAADDNDDGNDDGNDDDDAGHGALGPEDVTMDDVRGFVDMARAALAPLDFDIRSATNEWGDEAVGRGLANRLWVLVSTDHDPKAPLAVLFTPRKLAFVHRLLGALFDTYNTPRIEALCITEAQALKLSRPPRSRPSVGADDDGATATATTTAASRDRGLKHSVVLALLQSLVRQGWLRKSAHGFYSPTTRTLLELEPFLIETFNDADAVADAWQRIKRCAACRELITTGLRCATPTCMLRLHDYCEEAFWRTQTGRAAAAGRNAQPRRTCPRCGVPWGKTEAEDGHGEGKLCFIGERAITSTDIFRRKRRQGRPSEGVDDLMRTLLPRPSTGAGSGGVAGPFQRAAARRPQADDDGQGHDDDGEGDDDDDE